VSVRLVHVDALRLGESLAPKSVDLAYLDPPFAVGVDFRARTKKGELRAAGTGAGPVAYVDRWPTLDAYVEWLTARLAVVGELLTDRASLWLHLDARAVHDAKCACDRVFGRAAFRGEVVWVPGNGVKARRGPGLAHQTLLLYARGDDFVWNAREPCLRAPHAKTSLSMHFRARDADGRLYRDRTIGKKTYRYYADEGRALGSVWADCPAMVANTPLSTETTGYPTQKPLKLLDRIVRASSEPGALVLDPFCGSGTTLHAAALAGRRALGADTSPLAIEVVEARLRRAQIDVAIVRPPLRLAGEPACSGSPTRADARARPRRTTAGRRRG
jgi:site-specific DNA-methyltransferase (adenine-specific)